MQSTADNCRSSSPAPAPPGNAPIQHTTTTTTKHHDDSNVQNSSGDGSGSTITPAPYLALRPKRGPLFSNPHFEIRPSAIAGLGAVASRTLHRGEVILSEEPLFVASIDSTWPIDQFEALSPEAKELALGLHRNELLRSDSSSGATHPPSRLSGPPTRTSPTATPVCLTEKKKARKLETNQDSFATGDNQAGLFAVASRFNHACSPRHNVDFRFHHQTSRLLLTVRADVVDEGTELTICYGESLTPTHLYLWYGFRCQCGACPGLNDEDVAALSPQW